MWGLKELKNKCESLFCPHWLPDFKKGALRKTFVSKRSSFANNSIVFLFVFYVEERNDHTLFLQPCSIGTLAGLKLLLKSGAV